MPFIDTVAVGEATGSVREFAKSSWSWPADQPREGVEKLTG
jgi:hypothetical protein